MKTIFLVIAASSGLALGVPPSPVDVAKAEKKAAAISNNPSQEKPDPFATPDAPKVSSSSEPGAVDLT